VHLVRRADLLVGRDELHLALLERLERLVRGRGRVRVRVRVGVGVRVGVRVRVRVGVRVS
jgi:hypothetical protein